MLAALIIVFREVFEAGLIIGIVLAVTRAVSGRGWWISAGVLGGVAGACIGLVLGAVVCVLTYTGLLKIPPRHLFAVTTLLIAFLAAGMAAQAITFLAQANVLTAMDHVVWDTSWMLSESSILGRALHT